MVFLEVAEDFLGLVWGLEVTSDRVNPPSKNYISVWICQITPGTRNQKQSLEPLQGMLFRGPCNPCKKGGVPTHTSKVGLFGIMFHHPKWTFAEQEELCIARGAGCRKSFTTFLGRTQHLQGTPELRCRVQSGMDMWAEMSLEEKSCQTPPKWDFGHNWGLRNRQNLIRNGSGQVIREVGPNIPMQEKSARPSHVGSFL